MRTKAISEDREAAQLAIWRCVLVANQHTRWRTEERQRQIQQAASRLVDLANAGLVARELSWLEQSNHLLALMQRASGGYAIPVSDEHWAWAVKCESQSARN